MYRCRECETKFSCSQQICDTCLFTDLEIHPRDHSYISYFLERDQSLTYDLAQANNQLFTCGESDCNEAIMPDEMKWHPHSLIRMIIGPLLYELLHSGAVRDCPRSQLRRQFPQSENPSKATCLFCKKYIPFWNGKIITLCITSGCFQGFCDHW